MRSMVEGASTEIAPSTTLRAVPLPRFAGEDLKTAGSNSLGNS
jgi:hypothetical protein